MSGKERMMRATLKFLFAALALGILLPGTLFAAGGRQITTQTTDGIQIWQTEFDVSRRKPGTYNIIVHATDAAGNVGESGPYNIKVDPMAGLAEVHIVYPERNMVVRGDVDIVGTAEARYGLKQVALSIDGGGFQPLEGLQYWNLHIPAADLAEGKHTVRVKALDEFDIEGPESKVDFILDYIPPEIELLSHKTGDLVSGSFTVKGMVYERNGIESLSISKDGGKTYVPLRHSGGKKGDPARYFSFRIQSKKVNDGALVYYVRAINTTGVSVIRPILFFVNNDPPIIDVMSPSENEDVYGFTQVTGRVISPVGLTQFYFEWPGEVNVETAGVVKGDINGKTVYHIPLRPGDPFWASTIFFSLANNRAVPFKVTAVDKSGNKSELVRRFQDKRKYRTPMHVIDYPSPPGMLGRMQLEWDQPIYGHILDGYFGDYIINDSYVGQPSAKPSFRIPPEMIPVGSNTIQLYAMDEDEALGPKLTLRVNKAAPPAGAKITRSPINIESPHQELLNFFMEDIMEMDQAEDHPWVTDSVTVTGSIDGFRAGYELEYRLRWDLPWNKVELNNRGRFNVTIDLAKWPQGPVPMEFRTIRNSKPDFPLYLPVNKYNTLPTVNFMTPHKRFGPVERSTTASGVVNYVVPLEEISYSVNSGFSYEPLDFTRKYGRAWFNKYIDFTEIQRRGREFVIKIVDRAGNTVEVSPEYDFDSTNAGAKVIHNTPMEGELITGDFEISGLAYTDVGVTAVYWRLLTPRNSWDDPETTLARSATIDFNRIETTQDYLIPLTLADVRDGENVLEVFAEDFYGLQGNMVTVVFKVSKAPPQTSVIEPSQNVWTRGTMVVRGNSYDLNGISEIRISMDNGVSYQRADVTSRQNGPSPWTISLNTRAYMDGQYSMLIRTTDGYGIEAFTNAIINIDNTPPVIDLGTPANGAPIGRTLEINGQVYDNLKLKIISLHLVDTNNPNTQMIYEPPIQDVLMASMDVRSFPDGDYTLTVLAMDLSGNETVVIRNVRLIKAKAASEIAIINPLPGIAYCGTLIVSGKITGAVIPETVTIMLDRKNYTEIEVNRYGIFRHEIPESVLPEDGRISISAAFETPSGERVASHENIVTINKYGPVLEIETHKDGDVITGRPWISGNAYMYRPIGESLDKKTRMFYGVDRVELSFDNGRTFSLAKGTGDWKYRLETSEMDMGILPIIIKASFNNSEIAVRRVLLIVDTRLPIVNTIGPVENSAYRTTIRVFGSAYDDFDMDHVEVSLRPGNKIGYAVPSFIQGLYFDTSILGGLNWCTAVGVTFFDDNVKVQVNFSQAPSGRYSGWAIGGKVLANIYNKNISDWFGLDWVFWRTSIVLGAHFSYFLMEGEENPLWMGEFLGQWEIIKADMSYFFPNWKYFKSLSFYMEPGIWFAPSDVDLKKDPDAWRTRFTIGFGTRINLF
jgi:hypothetical protein